MPNTYENKTPEELEDIKRRISEGVRARYSRLTVTEYLQENENKSKATKNYWDSTTPEEKEARLQSSIHSKESLIKSAKNNPKLPTREELLLKDFLNRNFPKVFGYNGQGNLNVCIGGRIPDFVRLDKVPQVISLFGEAFNTIGDVEEEILHYSNLGYECLVVWNGECYLESSLKNYLQNFIREPRRSTRW